MTDQDELAELARILRGISDQQQHQECARRYKELADSKCDRLVCNICTLLTSPEEDLQISSAVMLRQAISKDTTQWHQLAKETQNIAKSTLLGVLKASPSDTLTRHVSYTIVELAVGILEEDGWPELLDELHVLSKSPERRQRCSALNIFGQLVSQLYSFMLPHLKILREIITAGLNDIDFSVRLAALSATSGFVNTYRNSVSRPLLQPFVPSMLDILNQSLQSPDKSDATRALDVFVNWAADPSFFDQCMPQTLEVFSNICVYEQDLSRRRSAVEFLVTLGERQPKRMAENADYVRIVVCILLEMLTDVDNDTIEEWNAAGETDRSELSTSSCVEEAIDSFCIAIGGTAIVPEAFPKITQMINCKPDWRRRYAGLVAVALMAEGCKDTIENLLDYVVSSFILPTIDSEHPRVRWACLNAIGQLAIDFSPKFIEKFHQLLIPKVCEMFDDAQNPRIQCYTAYCLINCIEDTSAQVLLPYVDLILSKLYMLMNTMASNPSMLESVVTCVGALAGAIKDYFLPYYDNFVPLFKGILATDDANDRLHVLKNKIIESISLIGSAVGKEKFLPDVQEYMEALRCADIGELGQEDSMRDALLMAAARVCSCLGDSFIPFLPMVMPVLLQTANMPDATFFDINSADSPQITGRGGWHYIIIGNRAVGIHNSALEEKTVAVRMIYCIADTLKGGIIEYIEEIVKVIIPLLTFAYHKDIRTTASSSVPSILTCIYDYNQIHADRPYPMSENVISYCLEHLIEAIKTETELDALAIQIHCICDCIELLPPNSIHPSLAKSLVNLLPAILCTLEDASERRTSKEQTGNYDDEDLEQWNLDIEREDDCCKEMADLIGVLCRTQPQVISPYLIQQFQFVSGLLQKEKPRSYHQLGLCIVADSVEHLREAVWPYYQEFLPFLFAYAHDEDPAIQQAIAYGLGAFSQQGKEHFAPWVDQALESIVSLIGRHNSSTEDQEVTENAVCALGKLLYYQPGSVKYHSEMLPYWLSCLPLCVDYLESPVCHGILCSFIEQDNQYLWGNQYQHLPKILSIFSWCLGKKSFGFTNEPLKNRVLAILRKMQEQGPELLRTATSLLSPDDQNVLSSSMLLGGP
ncbi:importin-5-like [Schistocerca gregaria]|uniref:importin-5-like n=1 Tax=Schistocerca gregaria TaxID=7010 RepID=UPI00211E6395|nr:importin-5-like [Schistocerca gregaria]